MGLAKRYFLDKDRSGHGKSFGWQGTLQRGRKPRCVIRIIINDVDIKKCTHIKSNLLVGTSPCPTVEQIGDLRGHV